MFSTFLIVCVDYTHLFKNDDPKWEEAIHFERLKRYILPLFLNIPLKAKHKRSKKNVALSCFLLFFGYLCRNPLPFRWFSWAVVYWRRSTKLDSEQLFWSVNSTCCIYLLSSYQTKKIPRKCRYNLTTSWQTALFLEIIIQLIYSSVSDIYC